MGRIGYFLKEDNDGAAEAELLARDRLAHELMYFSRGNPVIYYGDEQGFTGDDPAGIRRPASRCSPARSRSTSTTICWARLAPTPRTTSTPSHPLYRGIEQLATLTKSTRRCATGPTSTATPATEQGSTRSPGCYRGQQREYVVALNNSEHGTRRRRFRPTLRNGDFTRSTVRVPGRPAATVTAG